MVTVTGMDLPGSQITQFIHYRNQIIDRRNAEVIAEDAVIREYKDAVDASIQEAQDAENNNWLSTFLGNPYNRRVKKPVPYEIRRDYSYNNDLYWILREAEVSAAEPAGLGQYTSGELFPSKGGKSFGVFGQGNPLKDIDGNDIEGSEVR